MAEGDGIAGSSTVVGTHDLVEAAHEFMEAARTFEQAADKIGTTTRSSASTAGGLGGFFTGLMGATGAKNGGGYTFSGFGGKASPGGGSSSGSGGSTTGGGPPSGGGFSAMWNASGNGGHQSMANAAGGLAGAAIKAGFQWGVNGGATIAQTTSNAMQINTANTYGAAWMGGAQTQISQGSFRTSMNASDAAAGAITLQSGLGLRSGALFNKMAASATSISAINPLMSSQQSSAVMAGFNQIPTINMMTALGLNVQGKSIQQIALMFMQRTGMPLNGISRTTGKPFTATQVQELIGPTSNAYADMMMMVQSGAITQDMAAAVLQQIGVMLQLGGNQGRLNSFNLAAGTSNFAGMNSIIPGSGTSALQSAKNIQATQSSIAQSPIGQGEMNVQLSLAQGMSSLSNVTQGLVGQFQNLSGALAGLTGSAGGDSNLGSLLGGKGASILKGLGIGGAGGDAGGSSLGVAGGYAGGFSEAAVLSSLLSGGGSSSLGAVAGSPLGATLTSSSVSLNGSLSGGGSTSGSTGTGGVLFGTDFSGAPSGSVPAAMCLYEVFKALGISGGYPGAYQAWQAAVSGSGGTTAHPGDMNPPPGALVFWGPGSHGYGHVAISVGGGKVDSPGGPRDKSWAEPFVNGKRQSGSWGTYSIGEITGGKLGYLGWTEGMNGKKTVKSSGSGSVPKGSGSIYKALRAAGASDSAAQTLVGIAGAESHWRVGAVGDVGLENSTWGPSYGMFQIRTLNHPGNEWWRNINDLQTLQQQVAAAMKISGGGTNFTPWSTYNSGAYKSFVGNQYDLGSWELGRDQVAKVHKGEMILPAQLADAVRQAIGGKSSSSGGPSLTFGQGSINITIKSSGDSTTDGRVLANSFVTELHKNVTLTNLRGGVR